MNIFKRTGNFLSCLIHENCEYSIKKILTYAFSAVIIYLVIFTDKEYYELLFFVGGLLGVRAYERVQLSRTNPEPDSDPGLTDDSLLGGSRPANTNSKRQLLTD